MSTQAQATTIRQQIVVDAPVDRAFRVFTEQMDRIKPREHNMLGVDIEKTVFEPRAGGRIYDRGTDGSECEWATVLAYEPPDRVVFSWNVSPYWQVETGRREAQRGRGPLHRREPRTHSGRARASPPRPSRRRLGRSARRRGSARWLAAVSAAVHRSTELRLVGRAPAEPRGRSLPARAVRAYPAAACTGCEAGRSLTATWM